MGISDEYLTRLKEILRMDDDAIRKILGENNSIAQDKEGQ